MGQNMIETNEKLSMFPYLTLLSNILGSLEVLDKLSLILLLVVLIMNYHKYL